MYRKHLDEQKKMEDQQQVITRVSNYPVVKDTWNKVSEVYQRGKEGSRILRFCGGMAESSASLAYRATQPVIERLPVGMVNDYAVSKLETLEEKYPVIVKPTEEMVDAVKAYSSTKLEEATAYGTNQFNRLAEVARLNAVIGVADSVVDTFLPPVPKETDESAKPTQVEKPVALPDETSTRVRMLSDKVKRRAYENAMAKAGALQKRSQEAIGKLMHTIDLIDFAQQNLRNVSVDDVKEKVKAVYEEITDESNEVEVLPADASIERKAIVTARALTLNARESFRTISRLAFALPAKTRIIVNDAYNYTENLYQIFAKTDNIQDFTGEVITAIRERMSFLEETAANLVNFMLQAAPLQWLASSLRAPDDESPGSGKPITDTPLQRVPDEKEFESSDEGEESDAASNGLTDDVDDDDDSMLNSTSDIHNSTANADLTQDDFDSSSNPAYDNVD